MAKKSRRSRRIEDKSKSKTAAQQEESAVAPVASADVQSTTSDAVPAQQAQPRTSMKAPDFSKEYHYVISDLNRIGILATALIAGLIALSFVL
jgi:hypothetical protein